MKSKIIVAAILLSALCWGGCHKHKDDIPSINGADGHITNVDGKDIHFASSSGNTAQFIGHQLYLEFNDKEHQISLYANLWDIGSGSPGNFILHDSLNAVYINILSNPAGQQGFATDAYAPDNGTVVISTFTKDHVIGELKQATLEGGGATTITVHDFKFNLKIQP